MDLKCSFMSKAQVIVAAGLAALTSGCSKRVDTPPVANVAFTASRPRVAIGSPVDFTYTFEVLPGAVINGDYVVFVHIIDARGDMIWTDDHDPPVKTSLWKPGQKIGPYTRTRIIPPSYIGHATVVVGLYKPGGDERLTLASTASEESFAKVHEFKVGELEILPATDNFRFGTGWYDLDGDPATPGNRWRWTERSATITLPNPKRDVTFYLESAARTEAFSSPQIVTIVANGAPVTTFVADNPDRALRRIPISASQLGTGDIAEIRIDVDKTFNPSKLPVRTLDNRDLGLIVFNMYIEPR
jgi:hypothetical protein